MQEFYKKRKYLDFSIKHAQLSTALSGVDELSKNGVAQE
jgi:hypothetical protein